MKIVPQKFENLPINTLKVKLDNYVSLTKRKLESHKYCSFSILIQKLVTVFYFVFVFDLLIKFNLPQGKYGISSWLVFLVITFVETLTKLFSVLSRFG